MATLVITTTDFDILTKEEDIYANCHDAADAWHHGNCSGVPPNCPPGQNWWYYNIESKKNGSSFIYRIRRGFLLFDTSVLGAAVIIVSAILSLYNVVGGTETDPGQSTLHIVEGVQNTPLVLADYGAHLTKTTSGGSITEAQIAAVGGGFIDIELNAIGLGWINPVGMTKLCLRVAGDKDNHNPTGNNGNRFGSTDGWNGVPADPTLFPKLTITYTVVVAPTVTTDPATSVGIITAIENGTLDDDGGEACDCGFEYGLTIGYGTTTPTQSKTTGESFSQSITGLSANTTYHFRAIATNSAGTSYGADRTFTTNPTAPILAGTINRAYALAREEL